MELKKYMAGAVSLVLFTGICAEGGFGDKVKDFYGEHKTAVQVAGGVVGGVAGGVVGVYSAGAVKDYLEIREIKKLEDIKSLMEDVDTAKEEAKKAEKSDKAAANKVLEIAKLELEKAIAQAKFDNAYKEEMKKIDDKIKALKKKPNNKKNKEKEDSENEDSENEDSENEGQE